MKKSLSLWQLGGFTFTAVLGTLLHFLYDWTKWTIFTPISAINESTWEHMKILFFPMFFFSAFQYLFFRKEYKNYWPVKLIGITVGTVLIPVLFYTYNGTFGTSPDWVNILIFFVAAGCAYLLEMQLFKNKNTSFPSSVFAIMLLCLIALLFAFCTYFTPQIPLFKDPITGTYGFQIR